MHPTQIERIVQAYGALLETGMPQPGTVSDTRQLPFPKADIKNALLAALQSTDEPSLREFLKLAFVNLAYWQDGVGFVPLSASELDASGRSDLAKPTSREGATVGLDKFMAAVDEHVALARELESFGF